jgi:hypothetical protein
MSFTQYFSVVCQLLVNYNLRELEFVTNNFLTVVTVVTILTFLPLSG